MIKIGIAVLLTILVSTSYGVFLNKKINYRLNDFVTPIGFALFMMLLQLCYYPAQLFNLPSSYEHAMTILVYLFGIGYGIRHLKEIVEEYWHKRTLMILAAFAVFLFVFYHCYIDISFSDSQMYLNYMSQNINTDHINLFNLWTGEIGKEWDTIYLFQGYYHFGSFLAWLVNANWYLFGVGSFVENIVIETWGLGMIYSIVSSMLLYNFAKYIKTNRWMQYLLLGFGLFYLNFFYWRVAFSFYGNTYRTIYTCALLFYLYRYFKEERVDFKYIAIIIGFAGISFSSSYLFISFSIMYALMVYLFYTKRRNGIREMADFVLPLLVYAMACFYKDSPVLFGIGIVTAPLYYLLKNKSFMLKITDAIEGFLYKHSIHIFVYAVTALLVIGGAIYYFGFNPGYEYNYAHYFQNHSNYDMIKDYFFLHTGKSQNLVNILRWVGVFLLLTHKSDNQGMRFFKYLFIVVFVVFLNPLCVIGISKLFASNVYYRTYDVIFNPLTEMLFMALILTKFPKKYMYGAFTVFVVYMIFYAHAGSFINHYTGEYGFYVNRETLPKYKMSNDNYDVLRAFKEEVKDYQGRQLRVISHAEGLRTFVPEAHQIFTAREYYYPGDRINYEFYEQARNHYPWDHYYETDFSTSCQYIERFDVDYVIVEWLQNWDFQIEIDKCGELIYENDTFMMYKFD